MKSRIQLCFFIMLVTAMTVYLTSCSNEQATEQPAANTNRVAIIKFVAAEYSTSTKPYLEQLVKDFHAEHPSIHVELQVINWDILESAFNIMISQNDPPDLLNTNGYAHYVDKGLLNPMDELVSPELMLNFYPHFISMDEIAGTQYAIPYVASIREMYYNKDLLVEAGIEKPPSTWSELEEAARAIRDKGKADGFGIDFTDNEIWAYLTYFFYGAGGGWKKDGRWLINSDENVEALTFLKRLYDEGLTDAEPSVTTRDEKHRILGNGKLGLMISGNYFTSVVPREFPGLKWGIGPIPVKDEQLPLSFGVQDVLVSFKTDHTDKEAIRTFLDFIYEDSRYEEFILRESFVPVTKTVGNKLYEKDANMKHWINQINDAYFYPMNDPVWTSVKEATRNMGQAVLLGEMSPQEALDRLQELAEGKPED